MTSYDIMLSVCKQNISFSRSVEMRKNNFFHHPLFNFIATAILVLALAFFYKYALSNYNGAIRDDISNIDTERLAQLEAAPKSADDALNAIGKVESAREISYDLLEYCHDNIRDDIYNRIYDYMKENEYSDAMWETLCGYSLLALSDLSDGTAEEYNYVVKESGDSMTIAFAGDVSLDSNRNHWWSPLVVHRNNLTNLLESAFSSDLSEKMIGADLFCINLESPFVSGTGTPIDNNWRHASAVENVSVLGALGVDMVNIANDRIYDYSAKGLTDTLLALDSADVAYIGGGSNLQDARTPRYLIAGGRKIAFVSAAQIKTATTAPEASSKNAGIMYATNSAYAFSMIEEARQNADYVVVYTDWDSGRNEKPDNTQIALAHSFVDAGADIVIGTRSTVMQGIEYYEGKPIVYGLGNFWYETDRHEALLLQIKFERNTNYVFSEENSAQVDESKTTYSLSDEPTIYCLPCVQKDAVTRLVIGTDEGTAVINKLTQISDNKITIDENGKLAPISAVTE